MDLRAPLLKNTKFFIKNLLNDDSQLVADDIIEGLTKQFQDFSISNAITQSSFEEHYADYY